LIPDIILKWIILAAINLKKKIKIQKEPSFFMGKKEWKEKKMFWINILIFK